MQACKLNINTSVGKIDSELNKDLCSHEMKICKNRLFP